MKNRHALVLRMNDLPSVATGFAGRTPPRGAAAGGLEIPNRGTTPRRPSPPLSRIAPAARMGAMSYGLSIALPGPARPGPQLAPALHRLCRELGQGGPSCLAVAHREADLEALGRQARRIAAGSDDVLLLGMGGASLAARALLAIRAPRPPRLHVVDNIDPWSWRRTLAGLDAARTHVLAVSKSGETAETLALLLLALDWLAAAGAKGRASVVTEPGPRTLREIARARALPVLDHPPAIGGRFSALTVAGLLPAMIAGLDAAAVRAGAAAVVADLLVHGLESAPGRGAAALMAGEAAGAAVQVLMPYGDRLAPLARWWCQLWGESLGKRGLGSTPLAAAGAGDQHSQLQLWLAGARRHMVTVIAAPCPEDTAPLPATGLDRLAWLEGRSMGALFAAECEATCESLAEAGVPLRRLALERLDARAMGALFAHFMIETLLVAAAIGVCPFGQPAVEDGKRRARLKLAAGQPRRGGAPARQAP